MLSAVPRAGLEPLPQDPPDPRDVRFGSPPLPGWVRAFRPAQWQAIVETVDAFNSGAKAVFLDAPVGSGKSLAAEAIRRILGVRGIYLCTSKTLQDQFSVDFPYSKVLKGRANYPTLDFPNQFTSSQEWNRITAADCDKNDNHACDRCSPTEDEGSMYGCSFCHPVSGCAYESAKQAALQSQLAVTNTRYFLTEANYVGRFSGFPLVIVDEADTIENELMSFIEVNISEKLRKELDLPFPSKKTVADAWTQWVHRSIPVVERHAKALNRRSDRRSKKKARTIDRLALQLRRVEGALADGNWIYDGYEMGRIIFRPIKVNDLAQDILLRHGKKFLFMSGTIISPDYMAESLGLADNEWASVRTPSTFPPENRPIIPVPVANMVYKEKATAWPTMAEALTNLLHRHPDERILVHTVSYPLTKYLLEQLDTDPILRQRTEAYLSSDDRDAALQRYLAKPNGVLLASSFERGVDLKDDMCRVVVVCKIAFPDLKNKQVSTRLYTTGGGTWYAVETVRSLIQATGRGVRHENDAAITYILDQQFINNIWRRHRSLLPKWWKDALQWHNPPRLLEGGTK